VSSLPPFFGILFLMNLRVRDIRLQVGTGVEPMGKVEKKGGEEISYRPGDDVSAFFCSIQRIFFSSLRWARLGVLEDQHQEIWAGILSCPMLVVVTTDKR
jgi:hypothetical protein